MAAALLEGRHGDPFAVLGPHPQAGAAGGWSVRLLLPGAVQVAVLPAGGEPGEPAAMICEDPGGLFAIALDARPAPAAFQVRVTWADGCHSLHHDPYGFGPWLGALDLHLLAEGRHWQIYERLGAHPTTHEGCTGVAFAVWAPNAACVSVVGDFCGWDSRRLVMRRRHECGVWELFVPGLEPGALYKFAIRAADGVLLPLKADPFARLMECPPRTACVVAPALPPLPAAVERPQARRAGHNRHDAPISIYEVHTGSWRRAPEEDNRILTWEELAETLIPYASGMGFTHLELLPVSEHPFDGSWGYQPIGLFAPTARHGRPEGFRDFVAACHQAGLGVILDWVPGHFPADAHGLARFDGTALYEHADPREGFHPDWQTLIYNFGRREVANMLLGNALFWLEQYGVDGLRVDAVASMLYRDYSRREGEWIPNCYGGRENLEAIAFLQQLNTLAYGRQPGVLTLAEESTAWPAVSRPVWLGGLGFGFKWNMGWMHDSLRYMARDPLYRGWHHHALTFSLLYAFSENFVLPLSHDEVVHGKGSLIGRMPGDRWQKFANLRAYFGFLFAHPGKKLLFMGGEFAQEREWNYAASLDWHLLDDPFHGGVQETVRTLNSLYRTLPALHAKDCDPGGFAWIDADDSAHSLYSFIRYGGAEDSPLLIISHFTPAVRYGVRIGVPFPGRWRLVFNSDERRYGGSGVIPCDFSDDNPVIAAKAESVPHHGRPFSLCLTVPPLATIFFILDNNAAAAQA